MEKLVDEGSVSFPTADTALAVRASLFNAMVQRQSDREDLHSKALQEILRQNLNPG